MLLTELLPVATRLLFIKPDCRACGMGIACCGCPAQRRYYEQYKPLAEKYGKEQVDAVLAYASAKMVVTNKEDELKKAEDACTKALDICKRSGIQF